jgi:hypothetical protein
VHKSSGDNPAIALLAVLGGKPPQRVVVNEFTTVASVWTNAQFLNGAALQGYPLGLRIAAGNVPNFVDLGTGGWGEAMRNKRLENRITKSKDMIHARRLEISSRLPHERNLGQQTHAPAGIEGDLAL